MKNRNTWFIFPIPTVVFLPLAILFILALLFIEFVLFILPLFTIGYIIYKGYHNIFNNIPFGNTWKWLTLGSIFSIIFIIMDILLCN